jgi:hypothetical protein
MKKSIDYESDYIVYMIDTCKGRNRTRLPLLIAHSQRSYPELCRDVVHQPFWENFASHLLVKKIEKKD